MKKQKKNGKWCKWRHGAVRNIAALVLYPFCRFKYGYRGEKFREQGNRQYLILFNHQTAFDQFFVGYSFKGAVYYLASEDLFSKGALSSLIRFLVAPIPIKKQATDVRAVIDCMRVAREGGTIAMAPEGNRTFSGKNCYINPAAAPLARKLGLPIAIFRIEGGYGVHPRWSDVIRGGGMRGGVRRVIEPEEYASLTDDELAALIERELYVNDCDSFGEHKSRRTAEYLERAFYVCPKCGLSRFESRGRQVRCLNCSLSAEYTASGELLGKGERFPFKSTVEWYDYQCSFISKFDTGAFLEAPIYEECTTALEVIPYKSKKPLAKAARVLLYGDKITVGEGACKIILPFKELSAVTVLGKNKLNLYHGKRIYQIKGDKRFCALKFVNIFYRFRCIERGDTNEQFLGL